MTATLKSVLAGLAAVALAGVAGCNNPNPEKTRTAAEMPDTSAAGGRGVAPDTGAPKVTYTRPNAFREVPSSPTVTATAPAPAEKAAGGSAQPGATATEPRKPPA
jgi:hypothetical protein